MAETRSHRANGHDTLRERWGRIPSENTVQHQNFKKHPSTPWAGMQHRKHMMDMVQSKTRHVSSREGKHGTKRPRSQRCDSKTKNNTTPHRTSVSHPTHSTFLAHQRIFDRGRLPNGGCDALKAGVNVITHRWQPSDYTWPRRER